MATEQPITSGGKTPRVRSVTQKLVQQERASLGFEYTSFRPADESAKSSQAGCDEDGASRKLTTTPEPEPCELMCDESLDDTVTDGVVWDWSDVLTQTPLGVDGGLSYPRYFDYSHPSVTIWECDDMESADVGV